MLSEEGLILVVLLMASGLVLLGVLELVWPTRPRHPERRPVTARDPLRRARSRTLDPPPVTASATPAGVQTPAGVETPVAVETPVTVETPVAVETPEVRVPSESVALPATLDVPQYLEPPAPPIVAEPSSTADAPNLRIVASGTAPPEIARPERPRTPRARPVVRPLRPLGPAAGAASSAEPAPPSPGAEPEGSAEERGLALVSAGRFSDAVTLAQEALAAWKSAVSPPPTSAAREMARLWVVIGLGKSGLDDVEGARFAFEEAIALAPGNERLTWERHLVDLALAVGRRALVDLDREVRPESDRIATLRSAIEWLERGLDVAPDDPDLRAVLGKVRDALWPTHETIVKHFVQRREFAEARRMLIDVMADPECPPERRGAFRRLLGRAKGGEAAQTTVEASAQLQAGRPDETLALLLRAQSLIEAIPPDALAPGRRQELDRRLWAGYLALGANRVDAGAPDAALDPLLRAASLGALAGERREEARGLLVRTLGQIVNARSAEIGRLIDAGDKSVASVQVEKLWSLLRGAVDHGLTQEDLADPVARVLSLLERSGAKRF